jgi:hypothetical protein
MEEDCSPHGGQEGETEITRGQGPSIPFKDTPSDPILGLVARTRTSAADGN